MNRFVGTLLVCVTAWCASACTAPRPNYVVTDPDPGIKIPAIKRSVDTRDPDPATVGQLVKDLDSDDPAVRFYAIEGLRRLTGLTFEYVYYQDADERQPAVLRWNAWLAQRQGRPGAPDASAATTTRSSSQ